MWTGTRTNLSPVVCNDDIDWANGVLQSQVAFRVQAGVTYYIEIGEWWSGTSGTSATSTKDGRLPLDGETHPRGFPPTH